MSGEPERLDWLTFVRRLDWRQGEHVSLVGPTGGGKTTLALALLPARRFVVALGCKPEDATLKRLTRRGSGYKLIRDLDDRDRRYERFVLWPKYERRADIVNQQRVFRECFDELFVERNWCVFADEVTYLSKRLGLEPALKDWWQQGRSIGLTLVGATQRPYHVPLEMWSQATHLFIWRLTDRRDLDRIGNISGAVDTGDIRRWVQQLRIDPANGIHECLYVNTRTGAVAITQAPSA